VRPGLITNWFFEGYGGLTIARGRRDYSAGSNLLHPRADCEARRLALVSDLPLAICIFPMDS
jgi:hypothetical protein